MRIALDPVPVVLGIYAYVGTLLARASERHEGREAEELGRRFGRQRAEAADREVQRLVHSLHADIKIADKLLKKTGDVWKISQETDLVDLVVQAKGDEPEPRSYVLLKPDQIRSLLEAIRDAAKGTGEDEETVEQLDRAWDALEAGPAKYLAFGFSPWGE